MQQAEQLRQIGFHKLTHIEDLLLAHGAQYELSVDFDNLPLIDQIPDHLLEPINHARILVAQLLGFNSLT